MFIEIVASALVLVSLGFLAYMIATVEIELKKDSPFKEKKDA